MGISRIFGTKGADTDTERRSRKGAVPILGGLAVGALVMASAASLGGINSNTLGADASVVASCDTDGVDVTYTTIYSATNKRYEVTAVAVSGIATACNGKAISVDVANGTTPLSSGSGTVSDSSSTLTLAQAVDAEAVNDVAVLIKG